MSHSAFTEEEEEEEEEEEGGEEEALASHTVSGVAWLTACDPRRRWADAAHMLTPSLPWTPTAWACCWACTTSGRLLSFCGSPGDRSD